jgi:hypothetical protein
VVVATPAPESGFDVQSFRALAEATRVFSTAGRAVGMSAASAVDGRRQLTAMGRSREARHR